MKTSHQNNRQKVKLKINLLALGVMISLISLCLVTVYVFKRPITLSFPASVTDNVLSLRTSDSMYVYLDNPITAIVNDDTIILTPTSPTRFANKTMTLNVSSSKPIPLQANIRLVICDTTLFDILFSAPCWNK